MLKVLLSHAPRVWGVEDRQRGEACPPQRHVVELQPEYRSPGLTTRSKWIGERGKRGGGASQQHRSENVLVEA